MLYVPRSPWNGKKLETELLLQMHSSLSSVMTGAKFDMPAIVSLAGKFLLDNLSLMDMADKGERSCWRWLQLADAAGLSDVVQQCVNRVVHMDRASCAIDSRLVGLSSQTLKHMVCPNGLFPNPREYSIIEVSNPKALHGDLLGQLQDFHERTTKLLNVLSIPGHQEDGVHMLELATLFADGLEFIQQAVAAATAVKSPLLTSSSKHAK
eukprot:gene8814-8993_t